MGCTLVELCERMDPREFVAWQGYFRVEPWEPEKQDARAALGAYVTASAMSSSKGRKPKPEDFFLKWDSGAVRRRRSACRRRRVSAGRSARSAAC